MRLLLFFVFVGLIFICSIPHVSPCDYYWRPVTEPKQGSYSMRWNPRFKNPWTDPDYHDFDKNSWQYASQENFHNQLALQIIDDETGEIADYQGCVNVRSISNNFLLTKNESYNYENYYKGALCMQDYPVARSVMTVALEHREYINCVGAINNQTIFFFGADNGHMFLKDLSYNQFFEGDQRSLRIWVQWREKGQDEIGFSTPILPMLPDTLKPYRIELAEPLPESVVANTPFTVKLKMLNKDGDIITSSINSGLEIMIQVSYIHKWFSRAGGLWLTHTDAVMGGPEVVTSVINDQVIFTNFVKGIATATLTIEDIFENLELNFTSKFHVHNYRRYPDKEWFPYKSNGMVLSFPYFQIYGEHLTNPQSNTTHIKYQHFENKTDYFRAVKIANISVTAQTPKTLRFVPASLAKLRNIQKVYRSFEEPLIIEILDVNDRRVTSGPDSELLVTPSSDVIGTVFSSDAPFKLHRGVGTFKGSIVQKVDITKVKFHVSSSVGNLETEYTPDFIVQESLWLGIQPSLEEWNTMGALTRYFYGVGGGPLTGIGQFNIAFSAKNITELETMFKNEKKVELFYQTVSVEMSAVIGPRIEKHIPLFAGLAAVHDIPIYNYKTSKTIYSDKKKYPNFIRLRFSEEYENNLLCNFLKSRTWDNVVVVYSLAEDVPIPYEFEACASKFILNYNTVVFPIVRDNVTDLPSQSINEFLEGIEKTKIKIIVSFVGGHALNYMAAEVTKRGLTSQNGYQWIGTNKMYENFPYSNEGRCAELTNISCTEAFKGTFIFRPYYPLHGLESRDWKIMKSEYSSYVFWKHGNNPVYEPLPTDEDDLLQVALAHDALSVFVSSWVELSKTKSTMNMKNMLYHARNTHTITWISGDSVLFDDNLDRTNYTACLYQIDGASGATGKANVLLKKKLIQLGQNVTPYNIYSNNTLKEVAFTGKTLVYNSVPDSVKNLISIRSISGTFNENDELTGTLSETETDEYVPPSFYCTGGCGGKRLSTTSQRDWENGKCIKHETCECNIDQNTGKPGYSGKNCESAVCTGCLYGTCVQPGNCSCDPGYINTINKTDCGVPTCLTYGCNSNFGECTAADICKCKPGYYSKDCSQKCDCGEGTCSDGESGNGKCTCNSGYTGDKCTTHLATIAVPTVLGVCVVLGLLFVIGYKKYKQLELQAQLMSTEWMADWDNIRMRQKNKSSMKSLISMMSMISAKSDVEDKQDKIVCQNQGSWNGKDVVVKLLRKDEVELCDELRWEIKEMRDIKHPNICLFVGACIDVSHICILNEVCGKGSLDDILSNDDIDLGWDFRYSMLKDICRGMQYLLNTNIGSHGRLKCSNCLVDSRWTVKLSDYGLKNFKSNQVGVRIFCQETGVGVSLPTDEELEECDYYNLLWTAPEIIATGVSHPNHVGYGTKEGDVYSFAIIMAQMCTRNHPYHEIDHLSPNEIVQMVGRLKDYDKNLKLIQSKDSEGIPIQILRPNIGEDEFPADEKQSKELNNLIQKCWNQDPLCRPKFIECLKELGKISPHRGELMDNLIVLMEQYTTSLEAIVAERTADIVQEKEKGDLLLSKMLPPLIAEELKLGKNPTPEFFNCVTIYFSDCVGFGKICSDASPYQVVELLNDLYSIMDDVIESFDCYKVETIGDCYVVASGLPIRNGDNHAGEVASMALQLMTTINGVSYKHLPGSQVQLRVGINSGPIVAGVVGLRMPRYCLFGDTMNTASRMESGGFALKIHMSEDTFKVLERLGGYKCECRGERQVKGRGLMTTYWLLGKDGCDYQLPPESLALTASQHNFK